MSILSRASRTSDEMASRQCVPRTRVRSRLVKAWPTLTSVGRSVCAGILAGSVLGSGFAPATTHAPRHSGRLHDTKSDGCLSGFGPWSDGDSLNADELETLFGNLFHFETQFDRFTNSLRDLVERSRLARNNADWYRLLELCGVTDTLIGDNDGVYHPRFGTRRASMPTFAPRPRVCASYHRPFTPPLTTSAEKVEFIRRELCECRIRRSYR